MRRLHDVAGWGCSPARVRGVIITLIPHEISGAWPTIAFALCRRPQLWARSRRRVPGNLVTAFHYLAVRHGAFLSVFAEARRRGFDVLRRFRSKWYINFSDFRPSLLRALPHCNNVATPSLVREDA